MGRAHVGGVCLAGGGLIETPPKPKKTIHEPHDFSPRVGSGETEGCRVWFCVVWVWFWFGSSRVLHSHHDASRYGKDAHPYLEKIYGSEERRDWARAKWFAENKTGELKKMPGIPLEDDGCPVKGVYAKEKYEVGGLPPDLLGTNKRKSSKKRDQEKSAGTSEYLTLEGCCWWSCMIAGSLRGIMILSCIRSTKITRRLHSPYDMSSCCRVVRTEH